LGAGVGHLQPPTFFLDVLNLIAFQDGKALGPDHLGNIGGVYLYGQTAQSGGGPPSRRGCRLLIASSAIRPAAAELQPKRNAGAWKD
jgi:hypothetical protein